MTANNNTQTFSVNFGWGGLLFIVLLILKVNPGGHLDSGVEDWSWWWITAPLWISFAILLLILAIGAVVIGVVDVLDSRKRKKATIARVKRQAELAKERRKNQTITGGKIGNSRFLDKN